MLRLMQNYLFANLNNLSISMREKFDLIIGVGLSEPEESYHNISASSS